MKLSRVKRPKALWWQILHPAGIPAKPRKRIAPRSDRSERIMAEYRKERELFLLDHPRCQFPGCVSPSREVHHRRGRAGVLLMLKRCWVAICATHHRWIHEEPEAARQLGLLANKGEWNSIPTSEP